MGVLLTIGKKGLIIQKALGKKGQIIIIIIIIIIWFISYINTVKT